MASFVMVAYWRITNDLYYWRNMILFGQVYDDIDDLELYMGQRFDVLEQRFDRLEIEARELRVDLGEKMDAILRQITGMNS